MAKLTPVYYLESGTVTFWHEENSTASATVITPNAIVAKKQSNTSIYYDPYQKHTIVTVYKGEAEVADIKAGKKMLIATTNNKPQVAIIASAGTESSSRSSVTDALSVQSNVGISLGIVVIAVFVVAIVGYIFLRKKSFLSGYYSKLKIKFFKKIHE